MKRVNLILLACFYCTLAAAEETGQPPIFVHSYTRNPDWVTAAEHGILVNWLVDFGERANRPDIASLHAAVSELSREERFENTLACAFVDPEDPCQPIIFLEEEVAFPTSNEELHSEFAELGIKKTWMLHVIEQAHQGGYNLSVTATELVLTPEGLEKLRVVNVMYRDVYNKGSDAHSRGLERDDRSADPKIGSKQARAIYWVSGTPSRIETLVGESGQATTDMLRYYLAYSDGKSYKELKKQLGELPKVRDVDLMDGKKCRARAGLCRTRVLEASNDRVLTEMAGRGQLYLMSINIPGLY